MNVHRTLLQSRAEQRPAIGSVGFGLVLVAAVVSSWTGFRVGGLNLFDLAIVVAVAATSLESLLKRMVPRLPVLLTLLIVFSLMLLARDVVVNNNDVLGQSSGNAWVSGTSLGSEVVGPFPFLLRLLLSTVAVFLVVGLAARGADAVRLERLAGAWAGGAAISAAAAVLTQFLGLQWDFVYYSISDTRVSGFASHPNSLGQTSAMAIPVLVALAARAAGRPVLRLAHLVAALACLGSIWYSGSRAALLGLGIAVLLMLSGWLISRRSWAGLTAVIVLALPLLLVASEVVAASRWGDSSSALSNSLRLANLQVAVDIIAENLILGHGLGSWYGEMVPLILLTSGGLLYLGSYASFIGRELIRMAKSVDRPLIPALLISTVLLAIFGLLNNGLLERYLYWPVAIGWATAISVAESERASPIGGRLGRQRFTSPAVSPQRAGARSGRCSDRRTP